MDETNPKQSWIRRNYHWVVFLVVALSFSIALGLKNNLYSLFLIPITEDLQVSRGAFSLAPSLRYLGSFCSNLMFGMLYHRFGYRRAATAAHLLVALTYVWYGAAQGLVPFYIGAVVSGLLEPYHSTAATSRILREWFHHRQGTVIGVAMAASGLATSVMSGVLTNVTQKSGWRSSMVMSSGCLVVVAVLIVLLVSNTPGQRGMKPWGEGRTRKNTAAAQEKRAPERCLSPKELRKKPYFYLMILGTFLCCSIVCSVYSLIPAHVEDQGMSADTAAMIQSIMYLMLAASKVLAGLLCDLIGARRITVISMICCAVSMALLAVTRTPWMAILTITLFSLPLTIPTVILPVLTAEVFDSQNYGTVLGILLAMVSLGGAVAGPAINLSYDLLGSFSPSFWVMSGISAVTLAVYLIAFRGAAREKKSLAETQSV